MPDTHPVAITASDPDALHWLDGFDLEPEVCMCLAHGHELPCPQCERGNAVPSLEARS